VKRASLRPIFEKPDFQSNQTNESLSTISFTIQIKNFLKSDPNSNPRKSTLFEEKNLADQLPIVHVCLQKL
jgi:hypothetical protein